MKSKRKYNRKNTLRRENTLKSRNSRKKRKYSKRRKKMKGGSAGDSSLVDPRGLVEGISRSQLEILKHHNRNKDMEENLRSEALPPADAAAAPPPTLLPTIPEKYPSDPVDRFKEIIYTKKRTIVGRSGTPINVLDKRTVGFISGHGLTVQSKGHEDGSIRTKYFVVPDNISIAFMGDGAGVDTNPLMDTSKGFSYYPPGALCEDYYVEFRPITEAIDDEHPDAVTLNGSTGVWAVDKQYLESDPEGSGNINSEKLYEFFQYDVAWRPVKKIEEEDQEDEEEFRADFPFAGFTTPEHLNKYYYSDEFNILSDIMLLEPKDYSFGMAKLSTILSKLSDKRRDDPSIPNLFISHHCRGGVEGTPGIDRLIECSTGAGRRRLFNLGIDLEEVHPELLGMTHLADLSLRRESSLSSSSLLNNFSMVIQELFDYATTNNSSWLPHITMVYYENRNKNFSILDTNLVCTLLQLRHTLSIRDIP